MGGKWQRVAVSDIAEPVLGGTPAKAKPEYWEGGTIPWATAKDIASTNGRFIYGTEKRITWQGLANSAAKLLPPGTIVITARGTVGAIAQLGREMTFNQTCYGLVPRGDDISADYLYYALNATLAEARALTYGTVFETITKKTFDSWNIPLPPLTEQRCIARILGTLDDKIELNRRMNETLEAMAQALFKSWFVDFDPVVVNALKAGNPIPDKFADRAAHYREKPDALGLPREILRLFPDRFVDSELGPIPEGWEVREIKQCCEKVQNGGTPNRREKEYWSPGTIPWLTSSEVRRKLIIETINRISEAGLRHSSAKWLPPYSTVVALYGATAGQVALIATKLTTNQAVCGLVPRKWHRFFNYMALSHSAKKLCSLAVGAAQQNISKAIVESYEIVYPEEPRLIAIFDSLCEPYFVQWKHSLEQSRVLSVLRDTLLAKLMSGELRIPDVEKILEKAL